MEAVLAAVARVGDVVSQKIIQGDVPAYRARSPTRCPIAQVELLHEHVSHLGGKVDLPGHAVGVLEMDPPTDSFLFCH